MGNPNQFDWGGEELVVKSIVFADTPGGTQTALSSGEISVLDGVTAGTATASKAVVLDASKGIATITSATITTLTAPTIAGATTMSGAISMSSTLVVTGAATFNSNPVIGVGKTIDLDSQTGTLSSNAITATKYAGVITTEALTTAAGASQALAITLTGVAAGDLAFIQAVGGTNTRKSYRYEAATTTNTLTVTLYNTEPTNAINGTLIFNYWILKA